MDAGVSEQDWQLWREFLTMHRHLARELDRQLQRDAGISQADFSVLLRLSESPAQRLRTGELAELLAWEKSRVSHQVTRMEARDLLERSECAEDGRGTWVGLTEEGRRVLQLAPGDLAAQIRDVVESQARHVERRGFPPVELDLPDEPVPVRFDAQAVEQIVVNLLDNALKYAHDARAAGLKITLAIAGDLAVLAQ